jgi:hypothetical protein
MPPDRNGPEPVQAADHRVPNVLGGERGHPEGRGEIRFRQRDLRLGGGIEPFSQLFSKEVELQSEKQRGQASLSTHDDPRRVPEHEAGSRGERDRSQEMPGALKRLSAPSAYIGQSMLILH